MNPISVDPEVMGGTPCFAGTRVPIKNLFDLLAHGRTLDYFLEAFPGVTRAQALAVLEMAKRQLTAQPVPASRTSLYDPPHAETEDQSSPAD
jgi:uncharacterized protein (DUF433 family)